MAYIGRRKLLYANYNGKRVPLYEEVLTSGKERLSAPSIFLNGSKLSITATDTRTKAFSILVNGSQMVGVAYNAFSGSSEYDLTKILSTEGTYRITAKSVAYRYLSSAESNSVTYVVEGEDDALDITTDISLFGESDLIGGFPRYTYGKPTYIGEDCFREEWKGDGYRRFYFVRGGEYIECDEENPFIIPVEPYPWFGGWIREQQFKETVNGVDWYWLNDETSIGIIDGKVALKLEGDPFIGGDEEILVTSARGDMPIGNMVYECEEE